uniref:Uncharacterized protein n=1 Tax=Medicago truncatula TaxID=3880 RepID=I3T8M2_MEDTR|nr:unknown [Medicago truncatula]
MINRFPTCKELKKNNTKTVNITFLSQLPSHGIFWSMIPKGSQYTGRMKACSHVRGLIREVKISYLSFVIFKDKHIA